MAKRKQPQKRMPNYLRKILDNPPAVPGVTIAHVYHDGDCAHWRGEPCDCGAEAVYQYLNWSAKHEQPRPGDNH